MSAVPTNRYPPNVYSRYLYFLYYVRGLHESGLHLRAFG
jgi:hypothetical protein